MSNGKPSFLSNDEQLSNKVRVEHQPVNTNQVVYPITRFDSFIHPRWFYTFLLSTVSVSLHTFILSASTGPWRRWGSFGAWRCRVNCWPPWKLWMDLMPRWDRTLSRWYKWVWLGGLVGWAVRVCKRIRFIEGVKGFRFGGCLLCYVFFICFVAPILSGELSNVGTWGNWWREDSNPKSKAAPACSLPIFLANLNLSNPSKKFIRI